MPRLILRRILCAAGVVAAGVLYAFTGTVPTLTLFGVAVLLPLTALMLATLNAHAVTLELRIPDSQQKGRAGVGTLVLHNRSRLPIMRVSLVLEIENALTGERARIPVDCGVGPRERRELPFSFVSEHCGAYVFSCTEFRVSDAFGLRRIGKEVEQHARCLVLPDTFPVRVQLSGSEDPLAGADMFSVARLGHDRSETLQLRDYADGDDTRQIHWKLTQKLGRYIVADHSLEIGRTLLVVWDAAPPAGSGLIPNVADTLAEAAISFCMSLAAAEIPYAVAWRRSQDGDVVVQDIATMDDLHHALPGFLTGSDRRTSLVGDLERNLNGRRFPLLAYFSPEAPRELERLSQLGRTTAFLCSPDGRGHDQDGDSATWRFSPDNYRSLLRDIAI